MASIAEMLISGATQTAQNSGQNFLSGLKAGSELAQGIQQVQLQRKQLEQKKADAENSKDEFVFKAWEAGMKMKEKEQKLYFAKGGPFRRLRDGVGRTDMYPDDKIDWITATPSNLAKANGVIQDIRNGKVDRAVGLATIMDETKYPDLTPYDRQQLSEEAVQASNDYIKSKEETERAKMQADAAMGRQKQGQEAAPKVDQEKKVREDYTKFTQTGLAGALAQLEKLKAAEEHFKKSRGSTGTVGAAIASRTGTLGFFKEKTKVAIDNARAGIKLKESLDSQFARAEAEQQYNMRGPDPDLSDKENYKRAKAQREEAEQALRNKLNLFEQYGLSVEGAETFLNNNRGNSKSSGSPMLQSVTVRGKVIPREALVEAAKNNPALLDNIASELKTTVEQLKQDLGIK